MLDLPILRFQPIVHDFLWGGRLLGTELGKPIGDSDRAAESWEVVDHGRTQSVVVGSPLAGTTLHALATEHGEALFGRHHPQSQFPLLLKYLDCQKTLSVQVHPNDAQGAKLTPPELGKTEAWLILAAETGSKVYAGLKPGIDRAALEREVARGNCEECLHSFEPRVGDCLLIEAGTVHALGSGLLIAEIQQASDTTYRLFDWNRVDRDGRPRELHIAQALDTIDFSRGPVDPSKPTSTSMPGCERLTACEKFVMDRWSIDALQRISYDNRFHILAVVEGDVSLMANGDVLRLRRGDSALVPASILEIEIASRGKATLLDMYLP